MTRILLIEDNELNRDMLRRRLERRGYSVLVAADGASGLAAARADSARPYIQPRQGRKNEPMS